MTTTKTLALDRDWASYAKGTRFTLVERVPCGEIELSDGRKTNPVNLRVVIEGEAIPENTLLCRTIPEEYTAEIPRVGSSDVVNANQGDRDATVLATIGTQVLLEYEMPQGRVFGRVLDVLKPGWYKAVCLTNLPKKWQKELAA